MPDKKPITLADLRAKRDDILRLAEARGVYNVRVFGSVVRGDANADSDVDLLFVFQIIIVCATMQDWLYY